MRNCLLTVCCLMMLAACGGSPDGKTMLQPAGTGAVPELSGLELPQLPQDEVPPVLQRITAAVDIAIDGAQYDSASPNTQIVEDSLLFTPPADGMAWAMYRFGGTPGEGIDACSFSAEPSTEFYFGIADYVEQRWHFFAAQTETGGSFDLSGFEPGRYQSPAGNTYLVAVTANEATLSLHEVRLTYSDRFTVTGMVVDKENQPVAGVLIATPLGGQSSVTNALGQYALSGMPDGSWPIVATKDGWTFYDQPTLVTVAGANTTAPQMVGDPHGSRFENKDVDPQNNSPQDPPSWDTSAPLEETLSVIDDPVDVYRISISEPGPYHLLFSNPDRRIIFPYVQVLPLVRSDTPLGQSYNVFTGSFAIGFNVAVAPQELKVYVGASAGGGAYTMDVQPGATYSIGGSIAEDSDTLVGTYLQMTNPSAQLDMDMYMFGGYAKALFTPYWLPGMTTVTPQVAGYEFEPAFHNVDFQGETLDLDFAVTAGTFQDSHEPNGEQGTAPQLTVPYEAADPMSINPAMNDYNDIYKIDPEPGKGLRVRVDFEDNQADGTRLYCSVSDSDGRYYYGLQSSTGLVVHLPGLTTDQLYYVSVGNIDDPAVSYQLYVDQFDAAPLRLAARVLPDLLIPDAEFHIHDENFNVPLFTIAEDSGYTPSICLPEGTILNIECRRYGMALDGQTRRIVVGSTPQDVIFDAESQLPDSFEPNNDDESGDVHALVNTPITIDATIGNLGDFRDTYSITPQGSMPFKIELAAADPAFQIAIELYDSEGQEVLDVELRSGQAAYAPNDGAAGQVLALRGRVEGAHYSLSISEAPAYHISGLFTDSGAAPIPHGRVYNATTGRTYITEGNGTYISEMLPPGTYQIEWQAINFDPPSGSDEIVIGGANVIFNVSGLDPLSTDDYEPNNEPAQAYVLTLDTAYTANVGDQLASDYYDWYSIDATAGQFLRIELSTGNYMGMYVEAYRGANAETYQGMFWSTDADTKVFDLLAPVNETYKFVVQGLDDYTLTVTEISP